MKKKNYYLLFILIFIIGIILIFLFKNNTNVDFQEDFLFFKWLGNSQKAPSNEFYSIGLQGENENLHFFNVSYQNIDFKKIGLGETIDVETLANGKVAPGTKGKFEIVIYSNKDCYYQVYFQNEMEKPENMIFYITKENKVQTLEELQEQLKGRVETDIPKKITIFWEWEFENGIRENGQDTKDGKNLENYCFDIVVEPM